MVYHDWSEENVDWNGINDCCNILHYICTRWGRFGGQIKEKYGTVRFYAHMGHISLHSLVYPGYVYSQFPNWLWKLDCNYIGPFLRFFFERLFVKWNIFIYNYAYQKCLKKYPHLRAELLCAANHPELIKGATRREDKNTLHIVGWNGEILSTWKSG